MPHTPASSSVRPPVPKDPNGAPALQCQDLCKAFGQKIAVNMLSLAVPTGSIFGVVGPNGNADLRGDSPDRTQIGRAHV